jgi:hypothetical protein
MNYESSNQSNQSYDDGSRMQQREGKVARAIESQTAKLPSDIFLWAAGAAMIGSLAFQVLGPRPRVGLFGRKVEGRAPLSAFMGQWVPTLLIFGLYNKIVKVAGSDRITR